jgi:hypothetical protein
MSRTRLIAVAGLAIMLGGGSFVAFFVMEAAYRAYLLHVASPERFTRKPPGAIGVYGKPFWIYDEQFGYVYPKGESIPIATIAENKVVLCSRFSDFNEQGNVGKVFGDYDTADLKILVFGDSFTATVHDGDTWPNLLQRRLSERLNKTVNVVNFGRDGYGVLQMLDLAAAKIREWKPDLAIVAFITNDLQRVRIWRTITRVNGNWRYLVSPQPSPHPDPRIAYDTGLYDPDATEDYCEAAKATGKSDSLIERAFATYARGVAVGGNRAASPYTLRHSYLLARLRHGDPFKGMSNFFAFPVVQLTSYGQDKRFMEDLEAIRQSGAPLVLMHLAFYPEIKDGTEYVANYAEAALLESLEKVTGQSVLKTTDHIPMPLPDPERMNISPDNYHPSPWGIGLYADAVAEALIRNSYVH